MKYTKKTRGAVSVFLVLILVPSIVVTSIFVDLGRVHMSKSMSDSAADLALNTLLTSYDADLKEAYGLIASSQNIDSQFSDTADNFLRNMTSKKLSKDETFLVTDYYGATFETNDIVDLLKVKAAEGSTVSVTAIPDANLSNPALLKEQMVEFMKYRAPIEIFTGIIERLKAPGSGVDGLTKAEEVDEEESKQKTACYEAQGELLGAAYKTYKELNNYWKLQDDRAAATPVLYNRGTQKTDEETLNLLPDAYREIHNYMVKNYAYTDNLVAYSERNITFTDTALENLKKKDEFSTDSSRVCIVETLPDGTQKCYVDQAKITEHLDDLEDAIKDFETAKGAFEGAMKELVETPVGEADNEAHPVRWLVRAYDALSVGKHSGKHYQLALAMATMMEEYCIVRVLPDCTKENVTDLSWQDRRTALMTQVEELRNKYLLENSSNTPGDDLYLKAVNKLLAVSRAYLGAIDPTKPQVKIKITKSGTPSDTSPKAATATLGNELSRVWERPTKLYDQLGVVINGKKKADGTTEVYSLDELLKLAQDYQTSLTTWENSAKAKTAGKEPTTLQKQDLEEIEAIRNNEKETRESEKQLISYLTAENINAMKTRLNHDREQLKQLIDSVESFEYGAGLKLRKMTHFDSLSEKMFTVVKKGEIPLKNGELDTYCETTFQKLFSPTSDPVLTLTNWGNLDYSPQLNPDTRDDKTPEIYWKMHAEFIKQPDLDKNLSDNESDQASAETKRTQEENEAKSVDKTGLGENISPSFSPSGKSFSLVSGLGGMGGLAESLISGNFDGIRDNMYSTTYIMKMFSYYTFENEGKYRLLQQTDGGADKVKTLKYGDTNRYSEVEETWKSEDPKVTENKSLTNQLINADNNHAYRAEVEYILFGQNTSKANTEAAMNTIYGIRITLNLVSGFINFFPATKGNFTAKALTGVANAIQAATAGIVPAPLTKVIVIPILAALESAVDMKRLKAGFPVEIYKSTDEEWWIALQEASDSKKITDMLNSFNPGDKANTGKGIFYSDYLTLFTYLGLQDESAGANSLSSAMYQRTAEVIQANMQKQTKNAPNDKGEGGYSMKNAQLYFQLEGKLRVEPLMITLPLFKSEVSDNPMETNDDWCTYDVQVVRGYS